MARNQVLDTVQDDPWTELWNQIWKSYFNAYFMERKSEKLLGVWENIDTVTNILVLFTATGSAAVTTSAVAGWSVWDSPTGKVVWSGLAGLAAVLSILSQSFGVKSNIKMQTDWLVSYREVRTRLEMIMSRMKLHPNSDSDELESEFILIKKNLAARTAGYRTNILDTKRRGIQIQEQLEEDLGVGKSQEKSQNDSQSEDL